MTVAIEQHFLVEELPEGLVRITRTNRKFASLLEMQRVWTELNRILDPLRERDFALLVDTREAPARNDPEFERAFAPLRAQLFRGFRGCAVLAASPAGRLQVQRHAREDGSGFRVFSDEEEALRHLNDSR